MVIADTSIWIVHLRQGHRRFEEMLLNADVACHQFIIGELACGKLKNRTEILRLLHTLPLVSTISTDELLYFIEQHALMGKGLGFVDIHLLASAKLSGFPLWTKDNKLHEAALKMKVAYS